MRHVRPDRAFGLTIYITLAIEKIYIYQSHLVKNWSKFQLSEEWDRGTWRYFCESQRSEAQDKSRDTTRIASISSINRYLYTEQKRPVLQRRSKRDARSRRPATTPSPHDRRISLCTNSRLQNLTYQILSVDRIPFLDMQRSNVTRVWCTDYHFLWIQSADDQCCVRRP